MISSIWCTGTEAPRTTHLLGRHRRTAPVVHVVLQVTVTLAKLEILQESLVLHQVEGVEHVKLCLHDYGGISTPMATLLPDYGRKSTPSEEGNRLMVALRGHRLMPGKPPEQ